MPRLPRLLAILLTFHVVLVGWIFFRAESFDASIAYLRGIAESGATSLVLTPLACGLILFGLVIHFTPADLGQRLAIRLRTFPAWALGLLVGVAILIVDVMRFEGVAPFIYYQF
jgi:hypothetical protein